ncbi:MAG: SPOR domain-containing protein [Henriciella sp.]|uniref:SPOR domain-containing protein n=1 Tax=Henriciella sp. TaxID=1968823 RepID=UPI0032EC8C7C
MTYRNRETDLGPYEEEYRGFEIRDDETARGPLILTLAIGVLIVFAAVVWNTYRQGVRPQDGALPMVVAEAQPYKRVPDDRGGVEIDDLDRMLYDVIDGSERAPKTAPQQVSSRNDGYLRGGPPQDLRPSSPQGEASTQAAPAEDELASGQRIVSETPASSPEALPPVESQPEQRPVAQPEPVSPAPQPASRFAFAPGGDYLVQISALRSEEAATAAWQKARRSNPTIFEGASMSIERADLGAKGVYFRLRAGAFGTRESASDFCDAYKAEGGDCIVVRGTA